MQLKKVMDAYLADTPDCLFVAYMDLASGLVLCSVGRKTISQEILDRLASIGGCMFLGQSLAEWGKVAGATDLDRAMIYNGGHIYYYLRMERFPDHALCFVCRRSADTGTLRQQALVVRKEVAVVM